MRLGYRAYRLVHPRSGLRSPDAVPGARILGRFRRYARVLAAALLVSLAAAGAASTVPHEDDCHDVICAGAAEPHDPSRHALLAGGPEDPHSLHCVLCHSIRLYRPAAPLGQQPAPGYACLNPAPFDAGHVPLVFPAAQPPLRAPPATSASRV